jgi:hypothetical protein
MNRTTRNSLLSLIVLGAVAGCVTSPTAATVTNNSAADSDADQRAQIKDAQKVISYFSKINPPLIRVDKGTSSTSPKVAPARLSVKDAIARYVPRDYKVVTNPEVDTQTMIVYDPSLPWIEALGKALAAVSLEMDANLYKKAMRIKAFETSIAEIIEKHVPNEYKVFTDAEVNLESMVRYDESQHWADALGKGGTDSGLDITANLTRKLIVIKPLITNNKAQIQQP